MHKYLILPVLALVALVSCEPTERTNPEAIKEAEPEILSMTTSELCYILDEMAVLLYKTTKLKRKKHGVFLTENFNRVYSKR